MNFKKQIKPQKPEKKQKKKDVLKNLYALLFDDRQRVPDAFESKIVPIKTEGTGFSDHMQDKLSDYSSLKILSPTQMF